MLRWMLLCSCVLSVSPVWADGVDATEPRPLTPEVIGGDGWSFGSRFQAPFLRDTHVGARPTPGAVCDPSHGYDHYTNKSKHYGLWLRPSAFAEDVNSHCVSRRFAPRGYGWANRLDCQQLDYSSYVVKNPTSAHGPAYYHRPPLVPCPCKLQGCPPKGALTR